MNSRLKAIIVAALVFALLVCIPATGIADAGSFSGDSDYGGGDWGGDWDSDWDSDWDDSWSSSDSSYSSSSSYYDSNDDYFDDGDDDIGFMPMLIAVVLIILVIRSKAKSSRKGGKNGGSARPRVAQGAAITPQNQLKPMNEFRLEDPEFSEAAMSEKIANLYVQMQQNWTAKDFSPMRPYMSDALFNQFDRQLQAMAKANRTNYVDRIMVQSVDLRGWMRDETNDIIIARVRARIVDYTKDDVTGAVVSGSDTAEKFLEYEWKLIRTTGVMSAAAGDTTRYCASCGAPMNVNQSGKCEYCGSVVIASEYDWVISAIKGVSQRTA